MSERWEWRPGDECNAADDYYFLFAPDGTEVAALTEPEDRVPYRDLSPVTDALNSLQATANRVERLEAALRDCRVAARIEDWEMRCKEIDAIASKVLAAEVTP